MASGREARALASQKQQEFDPINYYVETEEGARDMAAQMTTTLEEPDMMEKCIESMKGGTSPHVFWLDRKHGKLEDGKIFFINIEGTFTHPPW